MNHVDALLIGLLLKITGDKVLTCTHNDLASVLRETCASAPGFEHVAVSASMKVHHRGGLVLHQFGSRTAPPLDARVLLVGANSHWSCSELSLLAMDYVLIPLAGRAPALWAASLAWYVRESRLPEHEALSGQLTALINSDWLDPLVMFDKLEAAEAQTKLNGNQDNTVDAAYRIAQLEEHVAKLENLALVRHEMLAAKIAQQCKLNP